MRQLQRTIFSILCLLALAVPAGAGIHYQATSSTQVPGQGEQRVLVDARVSGDKAKVEFRESGNPLFGKGSYLLTRDGGKTLLLVDPQERTYARLDLQAILSLTGGILQGMGPLLKVEFSDPKVEKLGEEDGGTVAGLPTRHVRYRTSYAMKMRVLGMGNESSVVSEQEVWSTGELADPALGVWLRAEPLRTGNEQFDKLIAAEAVKVQGFPLKMVTTTTSTPRKGKPTVTKSSLEVTHLERDVAVPDSTFELPQGYQETEMPLPALVPGARQ